MNDEIRKQIALFRYGILAPLISGTIDSGVSNTEFFRDAAKRTYVNITGENVKVSTTSLFRWHQSYQKYGFDGLIPKVRTDVGSSRKIDSDVTVQIKQLKQEYPRIPATMIYQKLYENGTIKNGDMSLSTVTRFVNQLNIENKYAIKDEMRRYETPHINTIWYADSSTGLFFKINGSKKRLWIIAIIDDASRMITGIDIFFNDTYENVMSVMKSAVTKFGKPKILSLDNGSSYKNKQMNLLAARIGITLNYNPPNSPTGKAKVERWFRTLKTQWMSHLNMRDFKTMDDLRESLNKYVKQYNNTIHSSLNGISPTERFFKESVLIKRLLEDDIEKNFLLEIERRVSADNVVTINNIEYETPYRFSKQRIILRYSADMKEVFIINKHTGEFEEIKLLNKHENSNVKREKVSLTGGMENGLY